MASEEDLAQAEYDVLVVRQYGGSVDLKQRLIDLGIIGARQIDAIERGLGMKKSAPQPEDADDSKPDVKLIDMSRLGGSKHDAAHMLSNLRLDAGSVEKRRASETSSTRGAAKPHGEVVSEDKPEHKHVEPKGGFVPSWKRRQAETSLDEPDQAESAPVETSPDPHLETIEEQEEHLKHIIRHVVKSRTHEAVLDFLVKRRMNIVEPTEVAKGLALKDKQVRQILDDLRHTGIIKDIGTHPYALSPSKKDLADLKFFFNKWQIPDWHSKMLTWILDQENKG